MDALSRKYIPTFKYLGILISSDLSWSQHIQEVCSKARKIIGLIYRRYYQHTDSSTLLQLYISLVRPHVEYAAPVWDPHAVQDIQSIESLQKFALRTCSKQWDCGYSELLDAFNLPSLENRRLYLKLCHLFKIVHASVTFHQMLLFLGLIFLTSLDPTHSSSPSLAPTPSTPPSSQTLYEGGIICLRTSYAFHHMPTLKGLLECLLSL